MIIDKESWIRRFPIVLDPAQGYFLDGVRLAIQTSEASYERLLRTLDGLAVDPDTDSEPRIISAVQDAWFIIDAVDRVRSLVKNAPKLGPTKPAEVAAFLSATDNVRELRNHLQHLDGRLSRLAKKGGPAWGFLSWVTWVGEGNDLEGYLCALVGGTVKASAGRLQVRGWMPQQVGERAVVLEAAGVAVRLDALFDELELLVKWLESVLHQAFSQLQGNVPNTLPDLLTVLTLDIEEFKRLLQSDG